jgi:nucleotide-binding universal stress UspA family protein
MTNVILLFKKQADFCSAKKRNSSPCTMKKILVPIDFSDNSKHALKLAASIAVKADVALELLHTNTAVVYAPPLPEYGGAMQVDLEEYDETAATELFNIKRELSGQPGFENLKIETRVEEGFLYASIRQVAEEDGAGVIVMGTKGASGAVEFFVGSNTEKIIRTASCEVLAVPESSDSTANFKKVVLASTLQPNQKGAFKALAAWQKYFPFEVEVLYLNNPAGFNSNAEIEKCIQEFAHETGLKKVNANVSTSTFNEEASILAFAKEVNADLIAMVTHQRKGVSHLLFGSLTEDTVNHSNIPVLCIPIR